MWSSRLIYLFAALCVALSVAMATELPPTSFKVITSPLYSLSLANISTKANGYATWGPNAVAEITFKANTSTVELSTFTITYNGSVLPIVQSLQNGALTTLLFKGSYPVTYNGIVWKRAVFYCTKARFTATTKSVVLHIKFSSQTKVDYVRVGVSYIGHTSFSQPSIGWNNDISSAPTASSSTSIINWLTSQGGFGSNGGMLQIDFSITVLETTYNTPLKTFTKTDDFYTPDCDFVPFPVPVVGNLEGENAYTCTHDGDCHLLVYDNPSKKVYEMWRANIQGGTFFGGCTAVWATNRTYPVNLRGNDCTSADAGGFPISAMIFDPNEVASGSINHAIRFILPNSKIASNVFVYPGTHSTGSTSGPVGSSPPYGARLRLKSSFNLNRITNPNARVIAKALQKYGMLLADGGNVALTAASDKYTTIKWGELGINSGSLGTIGTNDFEVVNWEGGVHDYTGDCIRTK